MGIKFYQTRIDTGRHKLYKAERIAQKKLRHLHQRFDSIEGCQFFINQILTFELWTELNGPATVAVKSMPRLGKRKWRIRRRALGLAKYKRDPKTGIYVFCHISLAPRELLRGCKGGWDNFTILHELAHVLNPYEEKHGKQFLQAHLKLLHHALGQQAEQAYANMYRQEKLLP